jgi:hypothetical protein
MAFAIKTEVDDPRAAELALSRQKTMYGGKLVAKDDVIFVFASKNIARRTVCASQFAADDTTTGQPEPQRMTQRCLKL